MTNNFINEETGEEFFFTKYTISYTNEGKTYKSNGQEVVDPKTGAVLIPIKKKGPIGVPTFLGTRAEQRDRDVKHFKNTAKKHSGSDEYKHQKQSVQDREFGTMGYKRNK